MKTNRIFISSDIYHTLTYAELRAILIKEHFLVLETGAIPDVLKIRSTDKDGYEFIQPIKYIKQE